MLSGKAEGHLQGALPNELRATSPCECLQELRASTAWWRWICPFVSPLFMGHLKPHQLTLHFLETKETIVQRSQLEPQIFLALGDLTCHLLAHLHSSADQARSPSPRLHRNSEPHGRPRSSANTSCYGSISSLGA